MKKQFRIEGMSCTSCGIKIENTLNEVSGVISASVSYNTSTLYVDYNSDEVNEDSMIAAVEKQGYRAIPIDGAVVVGDAARKLKTSTNVLKVLGFAIVAVALYFILNNASVFNFIPEVNQNMGYGLLFVVGLLTSLHCIAMCGGINLSQCVAYRSDTDDASVNNKLKPSILYNSGRVISYTVIGGIVGALGSVISFSGTARGVVVLVAGVFMIIMGLNMMNLFPWLKKIVPRMPKRFGGKIYSARKGRGPLVVGLLNGVMPCGPLQAMQLYALGTGSFFAGALSMFLFSLGTVPLMFGFGALSSILSSKLTKNLMKVSAVLVIVLGVIMFGRGLNQSGVSTALANEEPSNIASIESNIQIVTTDMKANVYEPIMVEAGKQVRWIINAEESELNGCNNPVTIPKYNIEKKLVPGENIIEFTPTEEGDVVYTCWMGMISGNIRVVSDISGTDDDEIEQIINNEPLYELETVGDTCCPLDLDTATLDDNDNNDNEVQDIAVAEIKDGVQRVSIDVNDFGFSPPLVILQKDIKTEWIINGESLNGCNSSLVFPAYETRLDLQQGENLIELVPTEDFFFSCWMGMLFGYVGVVDDIDDFDLDPIIVNAKVYLSPAGACSG